MKTTLTGALLAAAMTLAPVALAAPPVAMKGVEIGTRGGCCSVPTKIKFKATTKDERDAAISRGIAKATSLGVASKGAHNPFTGTSMLKIHYNTDYERISEISKAISGE